MLNKMNECQNTKMLWALSDISFCYHSDKINQKTMNELVLVIGQSRRGGISRTNKMISSAH